MALAGLVVGRGKTKNQRRPTAFLGMFSYEKGYW
jgi:hypothetical protein